MRCFDLSIKNEKLMELMKKFCFRGICSFKPINGPCDFTGYCPVVEFVKWLDEKEVLVFEEVKEAFSYMGNNVRVLYVYDVKNPGKAKLLRNRLYGYRQTSKTKLGPVTYTHMGLVKKEDRVDQSTFIVDLDKIGKVEKFMREAGANFSKFYVLFLEEKKGVKDG